jgi:hypothetical protein
METHLRHEPTKTSKSGIKRLRGVSRPQFRLRVDDLRVFYDLSKRKVEVIAIVTNKEVLETFRHRDILTCSSSDDPSIRSLFSCFLSALQLCEGTKKGTRSPVATAKALHLLAPAFSRCGILR